MQSPVRVAHQSPESHVRERRDTTQIGGIEIGWIVGNDGNEIGSIVGIDIDGIEIGWIGWIDSFGGVVGVDGVDGIEIGSIVGIDIDGIDSIDAIDIGSIDGIDIDGIDSIDAIDIGAIDAIDGIDQFGMYGSAEPRSGPE